VEDDESFSKIRDVPCIRAVLGSKLMDITENDEGEPATLYLMFEEGTVIQVRVTKENGLIVSPGGE
jgi:hypothetical protein